MGYRDLPDWKGGVGMNGVGLLVRFALCLLLWPQLLTAEPTLRILSYDGAILRVGVSTDLTQFALQLSEDAVNWDDRGGRTWIVRGGTNEVVVAIPCRWAGRSIFVRVM